MARAVYLGALTVGAGLPAKAIPRASSLASQLLRSALLTGTQHTQRKLGDLSGVFYILFVD